MTLPTPGKTVRGSRSGLPVMAALDLLGRRMAMRIMWELRESRLTFRALQDAAQTNPRLLNGRLSELREVGLIDHQEGGYGVTSIGKELVEAMLPVVDWSKRWADSLEKNK